MDHSSFTTGYLFIAHWWFSWVTNSLTKKTHQNKTLTPTNSKNFLGEQGKGECSVTTDRVVGGKIIHITKTKRVPSPSCLLIASNPVTSISDHFKTSLPINAQKQFH